MKLQHELAKKLEETLGKDLEKEVLEQNYLPNNAFKTSKQRATALLQPAIDRVTNILTLAIIAHREESHEEDRAAEKMVTELQMPDEDIETATLYKWWLA